MAKNRFHTTWLLCIINSGLIHRTRLQGCWGQKVPGDTTTPLFLQKLGTPDLRADMLYLPRMSGTGAADQVVVR